jgi:putative transcriptional regulator
MPIVVDIDVMLARRKMAVGTLAERVGVTPANIAVLKNGRAKAVRFTTLGRCATCCNVSQVTCCVGNPTAWETPQQRAPSTFRRSTPEKAEPAREAPCSSVWKRF